jgi:hypothetical protein
MHSFTSVRKHPIFWLLALEGDEMSLEVLTQSSPLNLASAAFGQLRKNLNSAWNLEPSYLRTQEVA